MAILANTRANAAKIRQSPPASADERKRLVHKGLVLHFMVQLSISEDADTRLATRSMGRVHHRILYFRSEERRVGKECRL